MKKQKTAEEKVGRILREQQIPWCAQKWGSLELERDVECRDDEML